MPGTSAAEPVPAWPFQGLPAPPPALDGAFGKWLREMHERCDLGTDDLVPTSADTEAAIERVAGAPPPGDVSAYYTIADPFGPFAGPARARRPTRHARHARLLAPAPSGPVWPIWFGGIPAQSRSTLALRHPDGSTLVLSYDGDGRLCDADRGVRNHLVRAVIGAVVADLETPGVAVDDRPARTDLWRWSGLSAAEYAEIVGIEPASAGAGQTLDLHTQTGSGSVLLIDAEIASSLVGEPRTDVADAVESGRLAASEGRCLLLDLRGNAPVTLRLYVDRELAPDLGATPGTARVDVGFAAPSGTLVACGVEELGMPATEGSDAEQFANTASRSGSRGLVPPGDYRADAYDLVWDEREERRRLSRLTAAGDRWLHDLLAPLTGCAVFAALVTVALAVPIVWYLQGWGTAFWVGLCGIGAGAALAAPGLLLPAVRRVDAARALVHRGMAGYAIVLRRVPDAGGS